ncbi:MAG TPA: ABC transporter ATP-binding protein [bacterium]|nr:ABC transporter ATP-binding protein [bacterium]
MAELRLEALGKTYGRVWAVRAVDLTVADGEFVTLLGPSGCGKTTTLRMIAGFFRPTTGRILVDGRVLSSAEEQVMVPPERRGMGMVFQTYAVWPHMTAFQNVAYPLRRQGRPRADAAAAVGRALQLVKLEAYADRYPHELSGGQQQRVALARALVMEPAVLLLDEPLSNLDAKLREEMRFEIKELQHRLGITVVYVTHDQSEAMAMSQRIAVMASGHLVQLGRPDEIYERPATPFVASFLGVANFIPGRIEGRDPTGVRVRLQDAAGGTVIVVPDGERVEGDVVVCMRPEALRFHPEGPMRGRIVRRTYMGGSVDYLVQLGAHAVRVIVPAGQSHPDGEDVRLSVTQATIYPRTSETISPGEAAT